MDANGLCRMIHNSMHVFNINTISNDKYNDANVKLIF